MKLTTPRIRPLLLLAATSVLFALALAVHTAVAGQVPEQGGMAVDCNGATAQVATTCSYSEQQSFTVSINALRPPYIGYIAFQAKLRWDPAVLDYLPADDPDDEVSWPGCGVPARRDNRPADASVLLGCASFPNEPSGYTGSILRVRLVCIAPGTSQVTLVPRLNDFQNGSFFLINDAGVELVTIPTLTGATVYCGADGLTGDVDCSGDVTAIDVALTLQMTAGLLTSPPCPAGADVNGDGTVNSIDATLILQFIAGLLPSLD